MAQAERYTILADSAVDERTKTDMQGTKSQKPIRRLPLRVDGKPGRHEEFFQLPQCPVRKVAL
jgi:hypothetical protein